MLPNCAPRRGGPFITFFSWTPSLRPGRRVPPCALPSILSSSDSELFGPPRIGRVSWLWRFPACLPLCHDLFLLGWVKPNAASVFQPQSPPYVLRVPRAPTQPTCQPCVFPLTFLNCDGTIVDFAVAAQVQDRKRSYDIMAAIGKCLSDVYYCRFGYFL
jgi:hypothetical protein